MVTDTGSWLGLTLCDGRYRVVRKLGEGGMAYVYVARDDKLERDVVIKAPRANLVHDSAFAGRFTREVRSLAKLAHPHIVPLIDIGEHEGFPFAVMHYLTGGSLRDRQPKDAEGKTRPMAVSTLQSWLPAIAHALDFVHRNHYIHRDVKPENILFDEDGQVFLSDLGVVKALSDTQEMRPQTVMTGAGMVLGTPHYMSPELIMGEAMDGRVDQYALAVTLYEVLTGNFPFNGGSAPAIFVQHTTKPPPPIRAAAPDVPIALAEAIEKALAKTPADRFGSCGDFANAVLNAGGAVVVATLLEETPAKQGIPATLIERPPARTETPSDLRSMTRETTRPSPSPGNASAPAPLLSSPTKRGNRLGMIAVAGVALAALVGLLIWRTLPGKPTGSLELAKLDRVTLKPGDIQSVSFEIERKELSGDVVCWLDGLPEGVTAAQITLTGEETKGTLKVATLAKTAAGTIDAVLKAKAGSVVAETPARLAVPGLRIAVVPKQTLKAGETSTINVEIERIACGGAVMLNVDGLPASVTRPKITLGDRLAPDQTTFPLELRVADDAADYQGAATLVAKLDTGGATGVGELPITVVAAKKTKVDPGTQPPVDPPIDPPVKKDLVIAAMADLLLRAGERRSVPVRVERLNLKGPISVRMTDLPAGVSVSPMPGRIEAGEDEVSFGVTASPLAPPARVKVTVTASLGTVSKSTGFFLTIAAASPPPDPVKPPLFTKKDELTDSDPFDRVRTTSRAKSYSIFGIMKKGQPYVIDMTANFDSYLRLENNDGEVARDDNSGGGRHARIVYTPTTTGAHYIVATSADGGLGAFTITLRPK